MLTEGWDANTVTHVLGIRAFGTQLLCEQVVGRALRRASYDADDDGHVRARVRRGLRRPVQLPVARPGRGRPRPPKPVLEVRALPERASLRIEFPRLIGYRYEMPTEHLEAAFDGSRDPRALDRGGRHPHRARPDRRRDRESTSVDLSDQRMQHGRLRGREADARQPLPRRGRRASGRGSFRSSCGSPSAWIDDCVMPVPEGQRLPADALLAEYSHAAAERIHRAIVAGTRARSASSPSSDPTSPSARPTTSGSRRRRLLRHRPRATSTWCRRTRAGRRSSPRCSRRCPRSSRYAKNQGLNFKIPYTYEGRAGNYVPDFLIRLRDAASTGQTTS